MMKKVIISLIVSLPLFAFAQDLDYNISSYLAEGVKAPNTHHLGEAWLNFLVEGDENFEYNITQATFSPNSTLDWHKHSTAQVLIVVEGEGYYQERGKEPVIMKKGDVIKCAKDTEHWHTSSADSKVSYIAVYGSSPTEWTDKLTREDYDSVAQKLKGK
jgi:quercetin dioxygenase-like cupin family protein